MKVTYYDLKHAETRFDKIVETLPPKFRDMLDSGFDIYIGYRPTLLFWSNMDALELTPEEYQRYTNILSPHAATLLRAWLIQRWNNDNDNQNRP